MLGADHLISGQVGRGSFVTGAAPEIRSPWEHSAEQAESRQPGKRRAGWQAGSWRVEGPPQAGSQPQTGEISFAMSRPARDLFPLEDFRASCAAVLARQDLADILQLGCPGGYEPLRHLLLDQARRDQSATAADDLLITNGCQQALDVIGRVLVRPGDVVAVEDPVYPGLHHLLTGMGARLAGIPVGADGLDLAVLERSCARPGCPAAAAGGDVEFSKSHRRHFAAGGAPGGAGDCARGRRGGGGERCLRGIALLRRAAARAQAVGRSRWDGAGAQFPRSAFPGCA